MNEPASVMKLGQYRQQENQRRRGHASSSDLSWSEPEERLLAAVASAITLMETTARIQRETAEVLLALAQRDGNETGIQRLKRVDDTLRALTAPDSQLALLDGPNGRVLAEPLTARELTVLRLLRGTLTRREIAQELCVSANTIKSHVRAVYQKLGVSSRRDAIQRGRELSII